MNKISLFLYVVLLVALMVLIAPRIFARNRGNILRNIALWLALFAATALFYKNFGPESEHPLFSLPVGMKRVPVEAQTPEAKEPVKHDEEKSNGTEGYTPPSD